MKPGTEVVLRLNTALTERRPLLAALLPDTIRPERLIQGIQLACWKNSELLECSFQSLLEGALDAAALGVQPDGTSGQAWLVPFNDRLKGKVARLIVGYRGVTAIASRNGFTVAADAVLQGDAFQYREGTAPLVDHRVRLDGPRGEVIASWATANPRAGHGPPLVAVLPRSKLDKIKAEAPSSKKPGSAWNDMKGPGFSGMCRKSAIRALWPQLPLGDWQHQARARAVTGDNESSEVVTLRPRGGASRRPTIVDVDDLADVTPAAARHDLGEPAPDQGAFGFDYESEPEA